MVASAILGIPYHIGLLFRGSYIFREFRVFGTIREIISTKINFRLGPRYTQAVSIDLEREGT